MSPNMTKLQRKQHEAQMTFPEVYPRNGHSYTQESQMGVKFADCFKTISNLRNMYCHQQKVHDFEQRLKQFLI